MALSLVEKTKWKLKSLANFTSSVDESHHDEYGAWSAGGENKVEWTNKLIMSSIVVRVHDVIRLVETEELHNTTRRG